MQTTGGLDLTIYTSYDVFLRKQLPFGSRDDCTCVEIVNGVIFMTALCNRGGPLYFCPVVSFYLLSIYLLFFPRLISAAVDRMSAIILHMAWP